MPRPKRILWVDDEVDSLTSQILFLEQQGFEVACAAHGDDALVLLQRLDIGVSCSTSRCRGAGVSNSFVRSVPPTPPCRW